MPSRWIGVDRLFQLSRDNLKTLLVAFRRPRIVRGEAAEGGLALAGCSIATQRKYSDRHVLDAREPQFRKPWSRKPNRRRMRLPVGRRSSPECYAANSAAASRRTAGCRSMARVLRASTSQRARAYACWESPGSRGRGARKKRGAAAAPAKTTDRPNRRRVKVRRRVVGLARVSFDIQMSIDPPVAAKARQPQVGAVDQLDQSIGGRPRSRLRGRTPCRRRCEHRARRGSEQPVALRDAAVEAKAPPPGHDGGNRRQQQPLERVARGVPQASPQGERHRRSLSREAAAHAPRAVVHGSP